MDAIRPPPPPRILVYDGDCSLCIAVSRRLLRWTRRGEETRRAAQEFEGEDAERIAASEAHNELAVMDPASKEIRNGVAGIVWWLEGSRLAWLGRLLSWGPLRWAAGVVYPVIAYNRRILAPPRPRAIACACDPDPRPGATIALGAFALAVVVGMFLAIRAIELGAGGGSRGGASWIGREGATLARFAGLWTLPTLLLVGTLRPVGARLVHATTFLWSLALASPLPVAGAVAERVVGSGVTRWSVVASIAFLAHGVVFGAAYLRRLRVLRTSRWWLAAFLLPVLAFLFVPPLRAFLLADEGPHRDISKVRR